MKNIIIPKTRVENIDAPLIFLAGPVKGAPGWRDAAIEIILSQNKEIVVASPDAELKKSLRTHLLRGDEDFPRRRAWERHYLEVASKTGAIMFWLPEEVEHDCKKPYGSMTRIELGQWMTRYSYDRSVRLCFGSDGKFSELDIIKFDLSRDAPDKKIFGSLEETCREAVRIALRK